MQPERFGLEFQILGPVVVSADGRPVPINGLRRKALLARLVIDCARSVPTDRLIEDLWSGSPPSGSVVTLKSHVYQLRRALGVDDLIVTRSGGYVLQADRSRVDAFEFERLVAEARATRDRGELEAAGDRFDAALGLFRGRPLADLPDLDFAAREAHRLDQLRLDASEDRFDVALQLGRHATVVAEIEELADAHPLRERMIGNLMLALYRCGRQADALGVYQTTRRRLLEELGIDPGHELQALEGAILNQAVDLDAPGRPPGAARSDPPRSSTSPPMPVSGAPSSPPPPPASTSGRSGPPADRRIARPADRRVSLPLPLTATGELPFVGREAELTELAALWDAAAGGSRRAVIISGEPGIGKTRQAAELARFVAQTGGNVLYGACDEDLSVPYQPFAEALRHHLRGVGFELPSGAHGLDGELTRLMPELPRLVPGLAPPADTDPESQRHLLFEAVVTTLSAIAAVRPTLLVLEDIQWATKPTLLMLRHLLGTPQQTSLLVVATLRDTEPMAASSAEVLSTFGKLPLVRRLALRPLARQEAGSLIGSVHEEPLERQRRDRLLDDAQGNPFFLIELLRHLDETTGSTPSPAAPSHASSPSDMPLGIRDLIDRRISHLSGPPEVLTAAAILGRTFDLRTLAHIVGPSTRPEAVTATVDEAVASGMLRSEGPGRFAFAHDLVRHHLATRVGPAGRISLHLRVGLGIEALSDPDEHVETLAHHFTEAAPAGGGPKALVYSMTAAERALSQTAFEQGAEQIRRALDATRADPSVPPTLMAEAYECLALTAMPTPTMDFGAHRAACLEAADWARKAGSAEGLAVAAIDALSWTQPDNDEPEIEALAAEALALRDQLPADLGALLLATSVMYRSTTEDYGDPLEQASLEALGVARATGSPDAIRAAITGRYWSIFPTPKVAERLALADEHLRQPEKPVIRPRATRMHGTQRLPTGLGFRALAHLEMGERDAFEVDLRAIEEARDTTGMVKTRSTLWRGLLLLMDGRFDEAERLATGLLQTELEANYASSYMGQFFQVKYERGQLHELAPLLAEEVEQNHLPGIMHAATAVAYEQAGDAATARSLLAAVAGDDFAALPRNITWAAAFTMAAEATAALGESAWARSLYRRLLPHRGLHAVMAWGVASKGAYDRYLGMLAATAGEPDRARVHYEAALQLEERLRTPPAVARTQYWYGRLLLELGAERDQNRAEALLRAARATGVRLGMARLVTDIDHAVGNDQRGSVGRRR